MTHVGKEGEKGIFIHCWWECKLMQPLWKIVWRLLKKLKIDLPSDPAKPLLRIHPKECQIRIQQSHLHTHVYCSTIHNSSSMETVRMPLLINGIRKFIYNGMLFSRKEE
jgi:hypothetical protein